MIATRISQCSADCGKLIREGDAMEIIGGSGDHPTAYVHTGCLDEYERRLRTGQRPVRNAPQAPVGFWEATCERCGQHHAGPLPFGELHCSPKKSTCGGRLVWDDDQEDDQPLPLRVVA